MFFTRETDLSHRHPIVLTSIEGDARGQKVRAQLPTSGPIFISAGKVDIFLYSCKIARSSNGAGIFVP